MDWLPLLLMAFLWPIYAVAVLLGLAVLAVVFCALGSLIETIQYWMDGH
ncbi:MAG TPA: hypothetical protein VME69_06525 [Methylocella sp.]|nr:hypothetical protein [Methylocella sp.]